jgi:hypothetical protein
LHPALRQAATFGAVLLPAFAALFLWLYGFALMELRWKTESIAPPSLRLAFSHFPNRSGKKIGRYRGKVG